MNHFILVLSFLLFSTASFAQFDHSVFDQILKKYVVNGFVNYSELRNEKKLALYLDQLSKAKTEQMQKDELLAFWMNAYNAYTLKLIADHFPVVSIKDIGIAFIASPWDKKIVKIGGRELTLNNIEHDIIRKEFNEPRIHFALVCAAVSCPPLRSEAYTGAKLNSQLNDQVFQFFSNTKSNRIDHHKKTIKISKILDWYRADFEKNGNFNDIVWNYFPNNYRQQGNPKDYKIEYFEYDWNLNGK